ncbi:MAG: hypothetical protein ACKOYI_11045, partial [Actinomycetota bacterium]
NNALVAGQMSITVTNDAGTDLFVTKIAARKITASDGNVYPWNFSSSNSDSAVQVEEAGTRLLASEQPLLAATWRVE